MTRKYFMVEANNSDLPRRQELYDYLQWYKVRHRLTSGFAALSAIMAEQMKREPPVYADQKS